VIVIIKSKQHWFKTESVPSLSSPL